MKIAVLGGGGFRTPTVWESIADISGDVDVQEIVLHDPDENRLRRIVSVIEGLRREREGPGPPPRTTTMLEDAVEGSAAILCAIRVGGVEGRVVDETVPLRLGVVGQETVGPGGIAFALRTVPVMMKIAAEVSRLAPEGWFLNFTNPAGLVTEAVRPILGDRVVGICDSPTALCARVAAALGRAVSTLRFDYAGLNHLGWLTAVRDAGRDVLPGLLDDERLLGRIEEGRLFGPRFLRGLRLIPNEYLVYYRSAQDIVRAYERGLPPRGRVLAEQQRAFYEARQDGPEEALASWRLARDARHGTYFAEAWAAVDVPREGLLTVEGPGEAGYAAVATSFLRAVTGDTGASHILNVPNGRRLSFLDDQAVVEVPCRVGASGPSALDVGPLPPPEAELVARIKHVERLTIRGACERSAGLALEAIAAHPLVPSRDVAERILGGYLSEHTALRDALA